MSVSPSTFTKQPDEVYTLSVSFAKPLATGETMVSITVVATLDDVDVTSTVISGSSISGENVLIGVKGGTDGNDYKITIKATTDSTTPAGLPFVHEADVTMSVDAI